MAYCIFTIAPTGLLTGFLMATYLGQARFNTPHREMVNGICTEAVTFGVCSQACLPIVIGHSLAMQPDLIVIPLFLEPLFKAR